MDVSKKVDVEKAEKGERTQWVIKGNRGKRIGWIGYFKKKHGILMASPMFQGWTIKNLKTILEFMEKVEAEKKS